MSQERDPMINVFVHETMVLMEQLEGILIDSEKSDNMDGAINDIFRIMHTIKGNSMMMKYDKIAGLAHVTEDLFDYIRTNHPQNVNYTEITSVILDSLDFMKDEIDCIQNDVESTADNSELRTALVGFLESLKFMAAGESAPAPAPEQKTEVAVEVEKTENKAESNEQPNVAQAGLRPNFFAVTINFEDECQMENVRAFGIAHNLDEEGCVFYHMPKDLEDDKDGITFIRSEGFKLAVNCSQGEEELKTLLDKVSFMKEFDIKSINRDDFIDLTEEYQAYKEYGELDLITAAVEQVPEVELIEEEPVIELVQAVEKPVDVVAPVAAVPAVHVEREASASKQQKYINVSVEKLDALMNLVGELVISESMVTQNPELKELKIDSLDKAAGQLRKNINEIQDVVMEIRMVPLSTTFQRMNRIVRDMSVKINKSVDLVLIGQETEVDKNIIEHISDPLMHLIRNAIDHGLEESDEREAKGKSRTGTVTLEAKNAGGDVWIIVRDDGKGLDREKILAKAAERGSLKKPAEEYTDREAFNFIFEAGLSTKEAVTGFSGRGVGMDAVNAELEKIGGTVVIESEKDKGSAINLKIPLTLAIVNGMVMSVGESKFSLPITAIQEAFKARMEDVIVDPDGNEMILVRGECYSIIRLHELFGIQTEITDFAEGIFVMLKDEDHKICLFVDYLIGEHQVVVKSFSKYINKIKGISGCAHLGDGGICLILDTSGLSA